MPRFIPLSEREKAARIYATAQEAKPGYADRGFLAQLELVDASDSISRALDILIHQTERKCDDHTPLEMEIATIHALLDKITVHFDECESRGRSERTHFDANTAHTMVRNYLYIFTPIERVHYTEECIVRQSPILCDTLPAFCFRHFARWLKEGHHTCMTEYEIKHALKNAGYG